jgi:hypothetical protein
VIDGSKVEVGDLGNNFMGMFLCFSVCVLQSLLDEPTYNSFELNGSDFYQLGIYHVMFNKLKY